MQCSMSCAQGSMQMQGGAFVCMKFPCVSRNGKGLACTAKGCRAHTFKWEDQNDESGKELHTWFCGRHWNLAYDGCMNCQKIRQCMLQVCTNDELQGGVMPIPWCKKCNYPGGCTRKALVNAEVCANYGNRRPAVSKSWSHEERCKKQAWCKYEMLGCTNLVVKGVVCKSHWPPHEAGR